MEDKRAGEAGDRETRVRNEIKLTRKKQKAEKAFDEARLVKDSHNLNNLNVDSEALSKVSTILGSATQQ